jgi:hypothetical protein
MHLAPLPCEYSGSRDIVWAGCGRRRPESRIGIDCIGIDLADVAGAL